MTDHSLNMRKQSASSYFRSAGSYLGLKFAVFGVCGLVSQYFLTHYLLKTDYGLLVWIGSIILLLSPFGLPGISTSITGAVSRGFDRNFRRGTLLQMAGGTIGGVVLTGFAAYYWYWTHEETKALIFVVAGVLGPGLWLDTYQCYWSGKKNFKALVWWSVLVRGFQLCTTITVLKINPHPVWVFGIQTLIQVAANIAAAVGIMKLGNINNEFSKEYQSYGWFVSHLTLLGFIGSQVDKIIVGVLFGLEKLAVFAVGELIYRYFYKMPQDGMHQIFLPHFAEMKLKDASQWIYKRLPFLFFFLLTVLFVFSLILPDIYKVLFSTKYNDSVYYANLFLINVLVSTPALFVAALIKAHGLKKESAVAQIIISVTPLVLIVPFAYVWGLQGAVFVRIIQNLTLSGYYVHFIRRTVT